ncbi:TPA: hypothetical protein RFX18_002770 [Klebsiella quasipneumoniae subsp. similipneumoniae]|nr:MULTISPECIES: hypothetical protein [Klebsiella]MDM8629790.1 hypothetical protein [Klebsiella quasipneumoniae subsp. similipneumoniae]SBX43470.1 Uncharacterised protein [Klebsiella pneumoniae]HCM7543673.1 hypothetical protein [Klebsiella quasipneumoniae subsp. similipneumoniae]HDT0045208.1 hypothetical protein [Klebsiella quasipneumoniae subsp. similipneumoniae]HDU6189773.1 hypothetical protein [Klebsiella quasipneumoniae subsp. similipneumoniae]
MNIETVNELIQSLESAGELSIREQKFLKLAKEFKQLAAENVGLNSFIVDACWIVDDGQYCDATDFMPETPATDRIVAGIKADGVEEFVSNTVHKIFDESEAVSALAYLSLANSHVKKLREGADK